MTAHPKKDILSQFIQGATRPGRIRTQRAERKEEQPGEEEESGFKGISLDRKCVAEKGAGRRCSCHGKYQEGAYQQQRRP